MLFLLLRLFLFFLFISQLQADDCDDLFYDLEVVEQIDKNKQKKLPVLFNTLMQGGYYTMPSARMAKGGTIGLQWSSVPPYYIYNLLLQLYDRLELVGNYWVFKKKIEPHFGHLGFGDDAERAASFKYSLLRKEDGIPLLPEFALGLNDFIGTQRFRSLYVVATQTFLSSGLEATLGWGMGRIDGLFAGLAWTPWHDNPYFKGLTLAAEYDANDYKNHGNEHPRGREVKSRINVGLHWNLFNFLHANISTLRGKKIAGSAALTYNFGTTTGLFPKIYDPLPYTAPIDTQSLGEIRSQQSFAHELAYACQEQGLELYRAYLIPQKEDTLWMRIINIRFRKEDEVRMRLERLLSSLLPSNIKEVEVVIEADGLSVHEYHFTASELNKFREKKVSASELRIVAPLQEIGSLPDPYDSSLLYKRKKSIWILTFHPIVRTYFGSSSGKLKADVGLQMGPEGYLLDQIYYRLQGSYTLLSNAKGVGSRDRLNPSQIINVRSDAILYHKSNSFHVDMAYLQKSFSFGKGFFARLAGGYFETAYAGFALEALYYPVWANWAIGIEGAILGKRNYYGLGVQNRIRKFQGTKETFVPYFGRQYFLDFYYQLPYLGLDFKFSLGEFLAHDKGVKIEVSRTFQSGMSIGFWYTATNGNDQIGNKQYFDKGFIVTLPLDIFMNQSSKTRIGYGMAAWLRDVGAKARTGKELYPTIFYERFNPDRYKPYP